MPRIAHIINPFRALPATEHVIAQPVTMASMLAAANASKTVEVELFAAIFKGDEDLVPEGFRILYLERSLADITDFNARPLPLIADITELLRKHSDADYFIYTNIDIGLQKNFYDRAGELMAGNDSVIINRRGISAGFSQVSELPQMYMESGSDHPGYDCFIFTRELSDKLDLGTICIGIPRFERSFVLNLICFSKRILFVEKEKLTFHIGQEVLKIWGDEFHYKHNRSEYRKIRSRLWKDLRILNFPGWNEPLPKRYWRWLMNPNFSFPDNVFLEWRYRLSGR